ncbi:Uncharacterised protein [Vibrio cholerae]|nr:Uncharacterised protein [Vibrio cholerae]CSD09442.1 Uncharacterised protein [Vibrio cholerae]
MVIPNKPGSIMTSEPVKIASKPTCIAVFSRQWRAITLESQAPAK